MNDVVLIGTVREAVRVALLLAAGPLAAALIVGLIVSAGQAMTQMNEPTVGLIARLIAVTLVALVLLPWLLAGWVGYAVATFAGLPELV